MRKKVSSVKRSATIGQNVWASLKDESTRRWKSGRLSSWSGTTRRTTRRCPSCWCGSGARCRAGSRRTCSPADSGAGRPPPRPPTRRGDSSKSACSSLERCPRSTYKLCEFFKKCFYVRAPLSLLRYLCVSIPVYILKSDIKTFVNCVNRYGCCCFSLIWLSWS